jgi:CelD/BcsL family acetyltransferase involved in cellulose biosynthesis
MRVELIAGDGWDAVLEDWETLYRADPAATPFTSPAWGAAWMSAWADGAEPWLLRVSDADRVVGLAVFVLVRRGSVRILTMLGKEPGDYWDVLAYPQQRAEVAAAIAREVALRRRSWDLCVVNCMPPQSPTPAALAAAGLRVHARAPIACPSLALPSTFEQYLAAVPARRRTNIRRHLRRLDEGDVQLREVRDRAELPELVSLWQDLRRRQWSHRRRAITPEHLSERFRRFILEAVGDLLVTGEALVWEFRHDGVVAGIFINFVDSRAFYWYLGGIAPAALPLGIGKIAIAEGIRSSIAAGRATYDFTRGGERYKYWYGASTVYVPTLIVAHSGPRSRVAHSAARRIALWRDRDRGAQP